MGTSYKNNDASTSATYSSNVGDNTSNVVESEAPVRDEVNTQASNLPADQQRDNNINYLGSSYSGADIRVLVNIYSYAGSLDNIIASLEREQQVAVKVAEGTLSLLSGGLARFAIERPNLITYAAQKKVYLFQAGLYFVEEDAITQEAADIIIPTYRNNDFSTATGLSNARRQIQGLNTSYTSKEKELSEQIQHLRENIKKTGAFVELGTLQTISVQSHREKMAVRALGHSHVKGYTKGPRTIAGSMIFTVFNEHAFAGLLRAMASNKKANGEMDPDISSLIPDQLPPLDLTILFANEYGQTSEFRMYGVEILNDGVTYSIEDLLSENVMQFVARDVDPLVNTGNVLKDRRQRSITERYEGGARDLSGSKLLNMEYDYVEYLNRLRVRRRLTHR